MSWVKTDFWLGAPMKGFRINPRWFLRQDDNIFMDFYGHPAEYADLITFLFEQTGIIPEGSVLIGSQHDYEHSHTDVILIFTHKTFLRVEQGAKYPVEDRFTIDQDKWNAAMALLRARLAEASKAVALGVR